MKLKNPMIIVTDLENSKKFYKEVLGLRVIMDFGANITLTGGLCLQTKDSWLEFINASDKDISFGGNDAEIYFEEDDFDKFTERLSKLEIDYLHKVYEHRWGQRVVRFYDPDKHIIEVAEDLTKVVRKFLNKGISAETVATRMDVPVDYVKSCL